MKLEDLYINIRTKEVREYNINLTNEYISILKYINDIKEDIKKNDIVIYHNLLTKEKEKVYIIEVTENYIYGINQSGEVFAEPIDKKRFMKVIGSITGEDLVDMNILPIDY